MSRSLLYYGRRDIFRKRNKDKLLINPSHSFSDKLNFYFWQHIILFLSMNTRTYIIILLLLCSLSFRAQNISFNYLGTENGLSQFTVYALYEDNYGRIWMGTRNGLNVYNGNGIKVYKMEPGNSRSLLSSAIRQICGDGKENLYILTSEGICSFNMHTEEFTTLWRKGELHPHSIAYHEGKLLIGENGVIYSYDIRAKKLSIFYQFEKEEFWFSTLFVDTSENIWAGTSSRGVFQISKEKKLINHLLPKEYIYKCYEDSQKNIWLCTWSRGLFCFNNGGLRRLYNDVANKNSLSSDSVRDCCEDNEGYLWIATFLGLDKYDKKTGTFTHFVSDGTSNSLSDSSVYSIIKDRQGTLWIGTYFGGVNYWNPDCEIYTTYKVSDKETEGLSYSVIGTITADDKENLWIATEGGGLNFYNRETKQFKWYKYERTSNSISGNNIKCLYYDEHQATLWMGVHQGGLCKLDIRTGKFTKYVLSPANSVLHIIPYKEKLLIATIDGIFLFDPLSGSSEMFLFLYVHYLHIDSQGKLWICVEGKGVYVYDFETGKLNNYQYNAQDKQSIGDNMVTCIAEDSEHRLWFSTGGGGLSMYRPETNDFITYNVADGLASSSVYAICQSVNDKLLLTTDKGLTIFDYKNRKFTNYGYERGFPLTSINENSLYQDSAGEIFLGGVKGMVSFREERLDFKFQPYRIYPAELFINGELVHLGDENGILQTSLLNTSKIRLNSDQSFFSLRFATSNHIPNQDAIVYQLKGFSDEWIKTEIHHTITYTNLAPGTYKLIVRAIQNDETSVNNYYLDIEILPPWYNTILAYCIYAICLILILYYLISSYKNRIKLQESLKYEEQHIQDIEELNQSKLLFFTNISHEFRTPLTIIMGQIEVLLQSHSLVPGIYNKLLSIYKNGRVLRDLVNQLLDFRKQEQGHMKLKVREQNLIDFLYENYLLYVEYASNRQINFLFETDIDSVIVWIDANQMQKVANNLLSNAFKYTPDGGEIIIRIYAPQKDQVSFEIQDTGKGIHPQDIEHIFERFYQGDNNNTLSQGTGIGLALTKGIIELHHGNIIARSNGEKRTIFTVTLLLGKKQFISEEIENIDNVDQVVTIPDIPTGSVEDLTLVMHENSVPNLSSEVVLLIVEDNQTLREMLVELFQPYYKVISAADGEVGWEMVKEEMPDLILSDIVMPKMSGTELCKLVKSDFSTCHIPVALLTARTAIEHTIEGLLTGADDYITKPFNVNILISRCNNLINNRILLREKFTKQPQAKAQMLATNPMDKELLDRTVAVVEQHLDNPDFNLNDLVKELCISRTNFFKKLKAITGQTPNDFILTIKVKKAAYLLKHEPALNIAEISDRTGFSSARYFSRIFKQIYGISPMKYRHDDQESEETTLENNTEYGNREDKMN